jgi:hypothetical protein
VVGAGVVGAGVVGATVVGVDVGMMGAVVVGAAVVGWDVGGLVVLRGLGDDPAELRVDVRGVGGAGAVVGAVIGATHDTV